MSDQDYPAYVHDLLAQAEELIADEHDADPGEAAGLCFEVLALFPEHAAASELIQRAFSNPWLIRDNRKAISRVIDEWDDRPWQQRRRLARSFGCMSRWTGWQREYEEGFELEREGPPDVRDLLEAGRGQLLQDYLAGAKRGAETAWPIFREAVQRTNDPRAAMLWVAKLYAEQGYFAESVDVLEDLLDQFPDDQDARRLWAEVRWWRDNLQRIPWLPPPGDGSRWRRTMARRDPERLVEEEAGWAALREHRPPRPSKLPPDFALPPEFPPELAEKIEAVMAQTPSPGPGESPVDWGYLDALESGQIDVSRFPRWAQRMLAAIDDPEQAEYTKEYLAEYLSNPPISPDADE